MDRHRIITQLVQAHTALDQVLSQLSQDQLETEKVCNSTWSVKDILAHLTAWNKQFLQDIDNILHDTYYMPDTDTFNHNEIKKRSHLSYEDIYNEWRSSLNTVIDRIEALSDDEWTHRNKHPDALETQLSSIPSLFTYRYKGMPHEAGHANDIRKSFNLK